MTGMSGAGKTTVLDVLSGRGLTTVDTDYGDWVLPDGTLDEPRMDQLLADHRDIVVAGTAGPFFLPLRRSVGGMDPVAALKRIAFLLERQQADTYRVRAYRRAAWRLEGLAPEELRRRIDTSTLTDLPDVGPKTAGVAIRPRPAGCPTSCARSSRSLAPLAPGGAQLRARCAATCTRTRTGRTAASPIAEMAAAAIDSATSTSRSPTTRRG